jgi:hypothetical protein
MERKKELLAEIEALIAYKPKAEAIINPNYLAYLELEDLESIKRGLLEKVGKLSPEDIEWLQKFKKES